MLSTGRLGAHWVRSMAVCDDYLCFAKVWLNRSPLLRACVEQLPLITAVPRARSNGLRIRDAEVSETRRIAAIPR